MKEQTFILERSVTRNLTKLVGFLSSLPMDKAWKITIAEHRKTRSNEQNNALWGVAYVAIHEASGNDPEDMHEYFCGEYFGWVERPMFGQRKKRPRRTTTTDASGRRSVLTTIEFMDFYGFIQRRMAEFGIYVPDPNEEVNRAA